MAQATDYSIANASGATVRADINTVFGAVASANSGTSEPSTMYAFMFWVDTTNDLIKMRNGANNAWLTLPLSITTSGSVAITAGSINACTIGATNPSTGAFTTLSASTSITGTLATAAQTNITSLGTLGSATISGDLIVDTDTLKVTSGSDLVHIGNTSTGFHSSVHPLIVGSGSGDEGMAIFSGSTSKGKIGFADAASDDSGSYRGYLQYDHDADGLNIGTAGSTKMTITSAGNIFIGDDSFGGSLATLAVQVPSAASGGEGCVIRVGSTADAAETLWQFIDGADQGIGAITGNPSSNTTAYGTSSDYRLKENVSYTWDATTRLKQLKPARFNWIKQGTSTVHDGFLAHEVSAIVPSAIVGAKDAVDENDDPKYQQIDQAKLVPLLVKTIQELEARITALES